MWWGSGQAPSRTWKEVFRGLLAPLASSKCPGMSASSPGSSLSCTLTEVRHTCCPSRPSLRESEYPPAPQQRKGMRSSQEAAKSKGLGAERPSKHPPISQGRKNYSEGINRMQMLENVASNSAEQMTLLGGRFESPGTFHRGPSWLSHIETTCPRHIPAWSKRNRATLTKYKSWGKGQLHPSVLPSSFLVPSTSSSYPQGKQRLSKRLPSQAAEAPAGWRHICGSLEACSFPCCGPDGFASALCFWSRVKS